MEKRMVDGVSYIVKINNLNGISEMNMDCSWSICSNAKFNSIICIRSVVIKRVVNFGKQLNSNVSWVSRCESILILTSSK